MTHRAQTKSFKFLFLAASALTLAACDGGSAGPDVAPMASGAVMDRNQEYSDAKMAPSDPAPGQEPGEQAGILLAYSYSMGIEAPKTAIAPLKDAHEKACADAGPKLCQVLGSSVNSWGEDQVSAYLNLRAEPEWLAAFRTSIATDADKAGGRLTSNNVSTEDLTTYIVDLEARLEAKLALRERIKNLLETRDGSLSDILAAERALAEVQGEIDSMTAQRAAARARVAMSALSISYQSDPVTSTGLFAPLADSFRSFFRTSITSLAAAVDFVARAWPFFLVGLGALFVLRGWWRGRKAKS